MRVGRSRVILLTLVAAAMFFEIRLAHSSPIDPICQDGSFNQLELNQCQSDEFKKADQKLNEVYGALMAILDPEEQVRMRSAQRAWLTYRDMTCEFIAPRSAIGSMVPMLRLICLRRLTNKQAGSIELQLKCRMDEPKNCGNWDDSE